MPPTNRNDSQNVTVADPPPPPRRGGEWPELGAVAPLVDAWTKAIDGQQSFTILGHKRRDAALWPVLGELLGNDVPLYGGLDTVKHSSGVLDRMGGPASRS